MSTNQLPTIDPVTTAGPRWRRTRRALLVACYSLLSLWALAMSSFGPVAALTMDLPEDSLRFTGVAAGCFKVLTLGAALAVLLSRGRSVLAVRVLLVGQVVWLVTDLLSPQSDEGAAAVLLRFAVSTALWVGPWLLLATDRRRLWSEPVSLRRIPAALPVLAAGPLIAWSLANAQLDVTGTLPGGGTYAELRYDLTGLPLAFLTGLVLAALYATRWWSVALATVGLVVGGLALVYPDGYGAPGALGATGLLALSALVLLGHRLPSAQRRPPASLGEVGPTIPTAGTLLNSRDTRS
jgi:hypothetical protein